MSSSTSDFVVEVNEKRFQTQVIEKSRTTPILVDFWAPWCAPCRSLSPVLEKLAAEYGGAFILAKINTDENPGLATTFQIRSIPQVFLFRDGQAVDQFAGAYPEASIRQFLKPHCPSEVDKLFALAQDKLNAGQMQEAQGILQEVVRLEPRHPGSHLALAKLLIDKQQAEQARSHLQAIPVMADEHEAADRLERVIGFQSDCGEAGGESHLRKVTAKDPKDLDSRMALASCLAAAGQYREALEEFLAVVAQDKHYHDEGARKAMLAVFSLIGERSDLVEEFRGRLARTLY